MLKRKISCILAIAMVFGILPLTAFASEEAPVILEEIMELTEYETIPEETKEDTVCQHTETVIRNNPVEGEKTHTVTVVCTCGENVSQMLADCTDETDDGKCDVCEQTLIPGEEADSEPQMEPEAEPVAEPETEPENMSGDVNEDGQISTVDAMCILKYVAGLSDEIDAAQADTDKNGMVTAMDAAIILQYCAGLIDALPA